MSAAGCETEAVGCLLDGQPVHVCGPPNVLTRLVTVAVTNGPIFVKSVMDMTLKVYGMNEISWPPGHTLVGRHSFLLIYFDIGQWTTISSHL